jgi:formate hydrogenlyase subunit 3/multisubunit Na+/H+ antiporter MnhD subunit
MTRVIALLPLIPLAAALVAALPASPARLRGWLMSLAAFPALAMAVFAGAVGPSHLEWALLDTHVGLDSIGRVWLFFTSFLWCIAGFYAARYMEGRPGGRGFAVFYLMTMAGNLGLVIAQDVASFYLGFALMTFAGYGLVVHELSEEARRAGRVYLVMAVLGETMLLAGFMLAAVDSPTLAMHDVVPAVAASPRAGAIVPLLLAGFGIKAGALPLHMWLPLAHPVAPTPASAVLSGAMIKAGLLGWMRFLPLGLIAMEGWSIAIIALGIAAAFFGVIVGITQRDAKTTLAYSSISQMGFLNVGLGISLGVPEAWPIAAAAILAYVVHHGIAKGALFLGVGVAAEARTAGERRFALAGLALAALSIAGAPLTSGSIAKGALKGVAPLAPGGWGAFLDVLLPIAALGSTLLMARFLFLVAGGGPATASATRFRGLALPWSVLLAAVAGLMWVLPHWYDLELHGPEFTNPAKLWVMIWPVVAGALAAWLTVGLARRGLLRRGATIAPGDILIPVERAVAWSVRRLREHPLPEPLTPVQALASIWYGTYAGADRRDWLAGAELFVTRWWVAATLALVVILVTMLSLVAG